MNKKTIVFDFDGVIHKYSKGWQDGSIYDEPVEGIKEVINELRKDYKVVIVSTRTSTQEGELAIKLWLEQYGFVVDGLVKEKPPAVMYIDDRAINFNGNCNTLMRDIKKFKSWTEKASKKCAYCGKDFFDKTNNKKYCSVGCRIGANIEMANKDKEKEQC